MKYIPRPGVVLTKVCGTNLLIPNRQASQYCPYAIRLTKLWASDWKALSNGKSVELLYKAHTILTRKSEEEAKKTVDEFIESMCEKGFLIAVEDR